MARIIRCPSCGALWRLEGAAEENYLCSACGREFSAASAQTVEVDDQALDAALAELKAKKSEAAQAAPRQPMNRALLPKSPRSSIPRRRLKKTNRPHNLTKKKLAEALRCRPSTARRSLA